MNENRISCEVTTYNDMGHLELKVKFHNTHGVNPARAKAIEPAIKEAVYGAIRDNFDYFTKGLGTQFFKARRKRLALKSNINGYEVTITVNCHTDS